MFDELDKNAVSGSDFRPSGSVPAKTEDIFSEVDKVGKPEAFKPRDNNSPLAPGTVISADESWLKNKSLIAGLILGGLIILIGGGYLGFRVMNKSKTIVNTEIKEEVSNQVVPEVTTPTAEETNNVFDQAAQPTVTQSVDSDADGLTDEEEAQLITNVNNPDTDNDGLTDREEVKVYGTDPLKADTDGDGYADGQEVKNGFNPKGSGKLYEIKK